MKKLEEIQNRKIMSAYGGVQSIIETAENGSLLVEYYDQWGCFATSGGRMRNKALQSLSDPRLLDHIKTMEGYENVDVIYSIPTPDDLEQRKYYPSELDLGKTIKSSYFPGWFYCPHCRRLNKLENWEEKWNIEFPTDGGFGNHFPACYNCSKQVNDRIRRQSLEQVRFLLASADTGKLEDVPFDKIWGKTKTEDGKAWKLGENSTDKELFYRSSSGSDGLQSIYVQNGEGGEGISLSEVYSKYIIYAGGAYKLCLRNQNNIYYPEVINSLYIPYGDVEDNLKIAIKEDAGKGMSAEDIYIKIQNNTYAPQNLKKLSVSEIQSIIDGVLDYDSQEFAYIINPGNYGKETFANYSDGNNFYSKKYPNVKTRFVKCMYAIMRLKMTSVVPYFSRISTPDSEIRWYKGGEISDITPKRMKTYSNCNAINFIPGVESFGEGIFFEMDVESIPDEDRSVFVHTYSHMIMKELEYQCGYPLSSMKEKLYSKNDGKEWGILIYTIGGAEGSYGGLVSLFPTDVKSKGEESQILKIINYAKERVLDCPNDPICIEEENGHCYACLDIPEISCCKWNDELNRNIFIKYNNQQENKAYVYDVPNVILDDETIS